MRVMVLLGVVWMVGACIFARLIATETSKLVQKLQSQNTTYSIPIQESAKKDGVCHDFETSDTTSSVS